MKLRSFARYLICSETMMSNQSFNRIVIVGGGTAGWLTAGLLAAEHCAPSGKRSLPSMEIILIESPDISTIGVGEGTWPSMRSTLKKIGISETEFITACDASFKQGTLFQNWKNGFDDSYTHPFTVPRGYAETNLAMQWQPFRDKVSFAEAVSAQNRLMFENLAPKQISTPEYAFNVNYGYHLNAAKFAQLLTEHCTKKLGVTHLMANVVAVSSKDNGDIASLVTDAQGDVHGDLFIDCSGTRALLLGGHFDIPFCSKKQFLFNDSALASQVAYRHGSDPIASSTISCAQPHGWVWDIGLPSRRGVGHVYSSAHATDDQVADSLHSYIAATAGEEIAKSTSFRKVSFNPGHRAKFWHKNCVAIGMSAGFIEPLEASALVLVELSAAMIAEQFPTNRKVMDAVAKRFNDKFLYRWSKIIEFLKLHYVLSQRSDSDYWRDNVDTNTIPSGLTDLLELWRWQSPWHRDTTHVDEMFPSASYQYVLYGMGFVTQAHTTYRKSDTEFSRHAEALFSENAKQTQQLVSTMPSNRELIDKIHIHGLQSI